MRYTLCRLPGKGSGYAAKITVDGRHVATVSNPGHTSETGAREAAHRWERDYQKKLGF